MATSGAHAIATDRPSPFRRRASLAAVAAVLLLAGCGDDEDDDAGAGGGAGGDGVVSTTAEPGDGQGAPALPENSDPAAVRCTGPPGGTFDATAVIGEPLRQARAAAARKGCEIRVAVEDGVQQALTQDFRPDRVNVAVESGAVAEIIDIG